ncbi:MAG: RNA-binding protein [Chlorobiota bacterium]|nr:RNA-binding protein [Chlorobiota bacterium]QQS65779.1 MAG: RNA-binding protein [Chlorobiota bacterium]
MNIYVGNLSWGASEQDLFQAFSAYGEVVSAKIVTDKITGRSRGFGFVEMANNEDGPAAIEGMNGQDIQGRSISVNEARPRN